MELYNIPMTQKSWCQRDYPFSLAVEQAVYFLELLDFFHLDLPLLNRLYYFKNI